MRHAGHRWLIVFAGLYLGAGSWPGPLSAQARRPIDPARSTVTIHVDRGGLFSFFGDNHLVSGPVASGWISTVAPARVEFTVDAAALRVRDPWLSASDRTKVQERMLGPEVLDVERYPAVSFVSTSVVAAGDQEWTVSGKLTLHGATRDVRVPVRFTEGRYRGSVRIRQTDFGIRPVTVAIGTVRVKDEIRVEFEVEALGTSDDVGRPRR
jgi:polyisoprenoid-binding protein YceI